MLVPTEGLTQKSLGIRFSLIGLETDEQIIVAGPSTLSPFLPLSVGFKTLNIQRVLTIQRADLSKFGRPLVAQNTSNTLVILRIVKPTHFRLLSELSDILNCRGEPMLRFAPKFQEDEEI